MPELLHLEDYLRETGTSINLPPNHWHIQRLRRIRYGLPGATNRNL
jgi:hypothetical protein